jgi:4-hydroxy-2-oxoheptanedioate aldolase
LSGSSAIQPNPAEGAVTAGAALRTVGPRVGGWGIMGDRVGVEAMCRSGLDFVGIDAQHGFFGFEHAAMAVQVANLCGVHCLVRVPAGQLAWVPRYLDAGANGVIIAMVGSPEEAAEAVELSLYQPHGQRSYGGGPRNGVGQQAPEDGTPEVPEVFAMIETKRALQCLDEIAGVPGLAGLYVGPADLGLAIGAPFPLQSDDVAWHAAVDLVVGACATHGIRSGMFATDGDDARGWIMAGFSDVVLSSDIGLLRRAIYEHLERARQPVSVADVHGGSRVSDPYADR